MLPATQQPMDNAHAMPTPAPLHLPSHPCGRPPARPASCTLLGGGRKVQAPPQSLLLGLPWSIFERGFQGSSLPPPHCSWPPLWGRDAARGQPREAVALAGGHLQQEAAGNACLDVAAAWGEGHGTSLAGTQQHKESSVSSSTCAHTVTYGTQDLGAEAPSPLGAFFLPPPLRAVVVPLACPCFQTITKL